MLKFNHTLHSALSQLAYASNGCQQIYEVAFGLLTIIHDCAYTLILFTYSDFQTIFFPITLFAIVAAPVQSTHHLVQSMLWIWLHLLQANVSNQYKSFDEDIINRPWRPIPSGRISANNAAILRICLVPICMGISSWHGWRLAFTSTGLTTAMIIYDEFHLSGHWVGKNLCNVAGYLALEIGATKIMGPMHQLDAIAFQAMALSACIILTTIQAQDFSDVDGDIKLGRVTFPIYAPSFSRAFTFFVMVAWSIGVGTLCELGLITGSLFCGLGILVGWRYYNLRLPKQDSWSYGLFNIWLLLIHLLPAHARWNVLSL